MNAQILIKTAGSRFEFSKSRTGQLDFVGKLENENPDVTGWQKIASSTYFSPCWYVFLHAEVNFNPVVYVSGEVDVSDIDTFDYLVHVGALLAAVESKDLLLAGEFYLRRRDVFEKFARLTQFIMEENCIEILFSLCYGKMQNVEPVDVAKKKLGFDSCCETLEQAIMRYLKQHSVTVTLPLVGTNFYNWCDDIDPPVFEKLTDNLSREDLLGDAEKIRSAKHNFYAGLECVVQAEPYNPADKNAILCCIKM